MGVEDNSDLEAIVAILDSIYCDRYDQSSAKLSAQKLLSANWSEFGSIQQTSFSIIRDLDRMKLRDRVWDINSSYQKLLELDQWILRPTISITSRNGLDETIIAFASKKGLSSSHDLWQARSEWGGLYARLMNDFTQRPNVMNFESKDERLLLYIAIIGASYNSSRFDLNTYLSFINGKERELADKINRDLITRNTDTIDLLGELQSMNDRLVQKE